MININLLPEVLRKKERPPIKQILPLVALVVLTGLAVFQVTKYQFDIIPTLESRKDSLEREKVALTAKVEELKQINAEINKLSDYITTVKGLYKRRIVWSKLLYDVKKIVNFDETMSRYNDEMRYLWLTKFNGSGKNINLTGFATAANQVIAMQLPERLIVGFLTYTPVALPEKDEEARLQEELTRVIASHTAQRRENSDLPLQSPEEIALRQRLEEIKNVKSGSIAMQSFSSHLVPGSLKLTSTAWGGAPQPTGTRTTPEIFPTQAWTFNLIMTLK